MSTTSFKDLIVWQKSMLLTAEVYEACKSLPSEENYGISSQIKRSAVSIPSNIAEGYGRKNTKEYVQFLNIAYGSGCELETQLILISDIYNIDTKLVISRLTEVQKMLFVMKNKLMANSLK